MKIYQVLVVCVCIFFKVVAEEPSLYLSSQEDLSEKFIEKIQEEKERIFLASIRLSNFAVIDALIEAHQRNVQVEVLVDASSVSKKSCLQKLSKEGIPVWVWQGEAKKKGRRRMHHSFCVFGSSLLWTGSYGFRGKASGAHFEGALLLRNEKIAKEFLEEFEKMKGQGALYLPLHIQQKEVKS